MNDSKRREIKRQIHIVLFLTSWRPVKHNGFPSIPSIVPWHYRTDYKCTHKLQSTERQHFMFSIHLLTNVYHTANTRQSISAAPAPAPAPWSFASFDNYSHFISHFLYLTSICWLFSSGWDRDAETENIVVKYSHHTISFGNSSSSNFGLYNKAGLSPAKNLLNYKLQYNAIWMCFCVQNKAVIVCESWSGCKNCQNVGDNVVAWEFRRISMKSYAFCLCVPSNLSTMYSVDCRGKFAHVCVCECVRKNVWLKINS